MLARVPYLEAHIPKVMRYGARYDLCHDHSPTRNSTECCPVEGHGDECPRTLLTCCSLLSLDLIYQVCSTSEGKKQSIMNSEQEETMTPPTVGKPSMNLLPRRGLQSLTTLIHQLMLCSYQTSINNPVVSFPRFTSNMQGQVAHRSDVFLKQAS